MGTNDSPRRPQRDDFMTPKRKGAQEAQLLHEAGVARAQRNHPQTQTSPPQREDSLWKNLTAGTINAQIACPQCQHTGSVTTRKTMQKAGVSGGKATGAILTGGLSLLATGLSRMQQVTKAHCENCGSDWAF